MARPQQHAAPERGTGSARGSGGRAELLAEALRGIVFDTVLELVMIIDEGSDSDAHDDAPGWTLMETDSGGNATGRRVGGLHESLLEVDPNGIEAADFL